MPLAYKFYKKNHCYEHSMNHMCVRIRVCFDHSSMVNTILLVFIIYFKVKK